jgi:hypothetical protein
MQWLEISRELMYQESSGADLNSRTFYRPMGNDEIFSMTDA